MNLIGFSKQMSYQFLDFVWPALVDNGLSVVAVDTESGRVIGVFTGFDEAT